MKTALAKVESIAGLGDNNFVINALLDSVHKSGLHVVDIVHHGFYPQGLTAVIILAESHVAIHTYPETNEVFLDVFLCNKEHDPKSFVDNFTNKVKGNLSYYHVVDRIKGEAL